MSSPDVARLRAPTRRVLTCAVTTERLDAGALAVLVEDAAAGAVVTFAGVVRDHDHGREVSGIEYVGHPSAADVLAVVARRVAAAHPVDALAVAHRLGSLAVGDVALAVAVSAAHRGAAFAAAADLVDAVKAALPVWKRQEFTDGGQEWVGCP